MTPGQFHRPKAAQVVNAFERIRHETPSIFCTAQDMGVEARKLGRLASKGVLTDKKQHIVYSKARGSK